MIEIHVLGDGPRDEATVPCLVERVLGLRVRSRFRPWKSLVLAGGGYERKLKFAARAAVDDGVMMLVATVDTDADDRKDKLKCLRRARDETSVCGSLVQVALGEATPHSEAWLLDDEVAVREALALPLSVPVPSVRSVKDPKAEIERLRRQTARRDDPIIEVLAEIARRVEPSRCQRAKETGFHGLEEDLKSALKQHHAGCPRGCPCGEECPDS